jgi:hypothetical protein
MSFSGMGRSANARSEQEAGAMTASRWSATHPAHSAHREEQAYGTRFDESSVGYPSTSCSPAELASVSPTAAILLNRSQAVQRKIAARPTVSKLVSHARGQVQYQPRTRAVEMYRGGQSPTVPSVDQQAVPSGRINKAELARTWTMTRLRLINSVASEKL